MISPKPKRVYAKKTKLTANQACMLKHIEKGWQFKIFQGNSVPGFVWTTWHSLKRHKLVRFKGGWKMAVTKEGMKLLEAHK